MKQAVSDAFVGFSSRFEGVCRWMYLDVKGLVTTAIGNLIDTPGQAVALPWVNGQRPATPAEVTAEWYAVKARQSMVQMGGGVFARMTTLRLTDAGVQQVVQTRLDINEAILATRFPGWDTFPADAQLAIHSMAWAAGAQFHFPKFEAAAQKGDWTTCTNECHMDDANNPGLRPRNAANVALFQNAARVAARGLDPDRLWYPDQVSVDGQIAAEETLPASRAQTPS